MYVVSLHTESTDSVIQIGKAEQLGNLEQTFLALRRNSSSDLVPIIHTKLIILAPTLKISPYTLEPAASSWISVFLNSKVETYIPVGISMIRSVRSDLIISIYPSANSTGAEHMQSNT